MAKQKKQQNTKRIPPIQQIPSKKIWYHNNGRFKHQRNVPKHQMVTKTTKNWIIQTTKHDKIQIRMVWRKTFIQIDRFYPSSKRCNICGYQKNNLTLKIRAWKCPICGTHHHRDINAAKNILNEGLKTQNHTNMWKKIFFHWTHKSMGDSLTNLNTQVLTAQE